MWHNQPQSLQTPLASLLHQQLDKGRSLISDSRIPLAFFGQREQALYCVLEFSFSHVLISHTYTLSAPKVSAYMSHLRILYFTTDLIHPKDMDNWFLPSHGYRHHLCNLTDIGVTYIWLHVYEAQNKSSLHFLNIIGFFTLLFVVSRSFNNFNNLVKAFYGLTYLEMPLGTVSLFLLQR